MVSREAVLPNRLDGIGVAEPTAIRRHRQHGAVFVVAHTLGVISAYD